MSAIDVLCIGDLDVDLFVSVPEIPGFDQKVAGFNHGQKAGGMAANCAVAVSRLGLRSRLISAVGADPAGGFAQECLKHDGVDLDFLARRGDAPTFMCIVLLSPAGEKSLIRLETDAYLPRVSDLVPEAFEDVRHVHVTYGSPELSLAALRMAIERGMSTSMDLEPPDIARNPSLLRTVLPLVDTLFLNREAYDAVRGVLGESLEPDRLRPAGEIVVTLGAQGCRRLTAAGSDFVPGFAIDPVDTTGAGDCFAGAYLVAGLSGIAGDERLRFANAAAALSTRRMGAQAGMPIRGEVDDFLASRRTTRSDKHGFEVKGAARA